MSNITQYIKEAQNMDHDKFSMDILSSIYRETARFVGKDEDFGKEALARIGAMLSTLIEASQKTCKSGNIYELEGVLGAFKFRYCDIKEERGN